MVRIKICGIRRYADALLAVEAGADAVGFVFWPGSKRAIDPTTAAGIIRDLPPFVTKVGVFVNAQRDEILHIAEQTGIDAIQLHGDESPEFCHSFSPLCVIKAFRVRDETILESLPCYRVHGWLLDSGISDQPGGSGTVFPWHIAARAVQLGRPIILAGGLRPDNVAEAIRQVRPYAVDVASGVETEPGIKDPDRLRRFCEAVRSISGW